MTKQPESKSIDELTPRWILQRYGNYVLNGEAAMRNNSGATLEEAEAMIQNLINQTVLDAKEDEVKRLEFVVTSTVKVMASTDDVTISLDTLRAYVAFRLAELNKQRDK